MQSATSCAVPGRFIGAMEMAGPRTSMLGLVMAVSMTPLAEMPSVFPGLSPRSQELSGTYGQTQLILMLSFEYCRVCQFRDLYRKQPRAGGSAHTSIAYE